MDLVDASIPQGGEIYEPVRRVLLYLRQAGKSRCNLVGKLQAVCNLIESSSRNRLTLIILEVK